MKITYTTLFLLCLGGFSLANEEGFARYQVIIDRLPFGEAPPEGGEETVQIDINESFAKNLRLSMLYAGGNGKVRVGFVDSSKNDKSYILSVGETANGIELIEADIEASEALLKKGNEVALFKLEEAAAEILSKKQQSSRRNSYADRRKAQLEKKEAVKEEFIDPLGHLTKEELQQHLENVQMDILRKGQPALPIALTPEMDAQLVREGVLDPQ